MKPMKKALEKGHEKGASYALLALRLALGWLMFYAGISKLLEPGWTATGWLENATHGPFKEAFLIFANNPWVDLLVMWGLTLIGIALILGSLVRFTSFWGIVMMVLFYLPTFPPEHGVVDQHIIYILVFLTFMLTGVGHIFGLDAFIERSSFVKKNSWLKIFLG